MLMVLSEQARGHHHIGGPWFAAFRTASILLPNVYPGASYKNEQPNRWIVQNFDQ